MRTRQKVIMSLLLHAHARPTQTQLMKWLFLLRHESSLKDDSAFYDFVPYLYGPFSFEVYRELGLLAQEGFLSPDELNILPEQRDKTCKLEASLDSRTRSAVEMLLYRYGDMSTSRLLDTVYRRYTWYSSRSQRQPSRELIEHAPLAVYTIGYQGKNIDRFLDDLLRKGIEGLIDTRSNQVSRKYGFSGSSLARLAEKVGIRYFTFPALGIDSSMRKGVEAPTAIQELLDYYEGQILPQQAQYIDQVSAALLTRASALMCYEADVECCHRGRLAKRLSHLTGLSIVDM